MTEKNGRGPTPPAFADLYALRTDYEDYAVPELGGTVLRVYALTGAARAILVSDMADLAGRKREGAENDPALVQRVLLFEGRVVAASLGYDREEWDRLLETLGAGAIEGLYDVASRLSGLDKPQETAATERLGRRRKAASGTA